VEEDEVYKFQIFVQVRSIYIGGFRAKFLLAKEFATSVSDYKFLVYWRRERGICNVILI
jgi:hypothetical protein